MRLVAHRAAFRDRFGFVGQRSVNKRVEIAVENASHVARLDARSVVGDKLVRIKDIGANMLTKPISMPRRHPASHSFLSVVHGQIYRLKPLALLGSFALAGCGANTGARPAVEVKVVERVVEVQRPCPVKKPVRPAKLARPLPTDSIATLALVTAKLLEYDGPGGFADRSEAALAICTKPTP